MQMRVLKFTGNRYAVNFTKGPHNPAMANDENGAIKIIERL